MNFSCPNRIKTCDDPAEAVVGNLSAEEPDKDLFFARAYAGSTAADPNSNGTNPPPITALKNTQEEANQAVQTPPNNGVGPGFPDTFLNTAQTCTHTCDDGTVTTFTAPAKLFLATSQAEADNLAYQWACGVAASLCTTPLYHSTEQTADVTCADGTGTYTVAAGAFVGDTQAAADAAAFAFAQSVAQQLCGPVPPPPPVIYSSTPQTCSVGCAAGTITFTVAGGTAQGLTQAEADSAAHTTACIIASSMCVQVPPPVYNTPITAIGPCGNIVQIPAGVITAATLAEANALAQALGYAAAAEACQDGNTSPPPTASVGNEFTNCTVNCGTGGTYSHAIAARTYFSTSQAAANAVAQSFCQSQAFENRICLGDITGTVCRGTVFASTISASGSVDAWALVSGTLPPGVSFSNGALSGTPTTAGTYSFTVNAIRANGDIAARSYTIVVASVTTTALPGVTAGDSYAATLASYGITSPYWTIVSGSLPAGLSLNNTTGSISGTVPTGTPAGTSSFTVGARNGVLGTMQCTRTLSITVSAPPSPGPDWDSLAWGVPSTSIPSGCTLTFTPESANGAAFITTGNNPDVVLKSLQLNSQIGLLSYVGPSANCKLHLILDLHYTGDPFDIGANVSVFNADNPLERWIDVTYHGDDSGTIDIPFTIGGNRNIKVIIDWGINGPFSSGAASLDMRGTFSNV